MADPGLMADVKTAVAVQGPCSVYELHEEFDEQTGEVTDAVETLLILGELVRHPETSALYHPSDVFARRGEAKTLDEVYLERNLLALAFIRAYVRLNEHRYGRKPPFGWWNDETGDGRALVWVETDVGQVAWHVPRGWIPRDMPSRDPGYDGYSDGLKNDRVRALADVPAGALPEILPNIDPGANEVED